MRCRCTESSTLHWQGEGAQWRSAATTTKESSAPESEQTWAPKDIMHVGAVLGFGTKPGDVKLAQFSLLW